MASSRITLRLASQRNSETLSRLCFAKELPQTRHTSNDGFFGELLVRRLDMKTSTKHTRTTKQITVITTYRQIITLILSQLLYELSGNYCTRLLPKSVSIQAPPDVSPFSPPTPMYTPRNLKRLGTEARQSCDNPDFDAMFYPEAHLR